MKKYIIGFHVSVDDILCMQIVHSLRCLPSNVNELEHLELGLLNVQVFIQTAAFTPLCDNGQVIFSHVAHEEQNINMPGLP